MQEFLTLLGQIFLIVCLQSIVEMFIDDDKKNSYMHKIVSIACYLGSLYLLLQFAYNHVIKEIMISLKF